MDSKYGKPLQWLGALAAILAALGGLKWLYEAIVHNPDEVHVPSIAAFVGPEKIVRGETATLRWWPEGATELFLNDEPIENSKGQRIISPESTTDFHFRAVTADSMVQRTVSLVVVDTLSTADVLDRRRLLVQVDSFLLSVDTLHKEVPAIKVGPRRMQSSFTLDGLDADWNSRVYVGRMRLHGPSHLTIKSVLHLSPQDRGLAPKPNLTCDMFLSINGTQVDQLLHINSETEQWESTVSRQSTWEVDTSTVEIVLIFGYCATWPDRNARIRFGADSQISVVAEPR